MQYTKGNPELIKAAKAAAINPLLGDFYGMDGDGIQAPGAIVVREAKGGGHKYVVHFANTQSGGFHGGEYTDDITEARQWMEARIRRYDPTGALHQNFKRG